MPHHVPVVLTDEIIFQESSTTPDDGMTCIPSYISKAAEDICRAVQFETEENLEESVNSYRLEGIFCKLANIPY